MTSSTTTSPRIGARVLLLDPLDRVLLIHARDPDNPAHHWWELPGGGLDAGETPTQAAHREVVEETGITTIEIGRKLWTRESRFLYRGQHHHRLDHVYLARTTDSTTRAQPKHSANEKLGLIEHRWWTQDDLSKTTDKLLPVQLAELLHSVLAGRLHGTLTLNDA